MWPYPRTGPGWATVGYDRTARIWDPLTGRQRAVLTGHTSEVYALAVAPDGTWLATVSNGRTMRIWDPGTGHQRTTLTGRTGSVQAAAVTPDSTKLATVSNDRAVRIWDPVTGSISALMRADSPLRDCAWDPSGYVLAVAGGAGIYMFAF